MKYYSNINSPVGLIEISGDDEFVRSVLFVDEAKEESAALSKALRECKKQLQEYFDGKRKVFELSLSQEGSDFQQRVWGQLIAIDFGKTRSYMQLAKALGDPKCIRAAGTANGKNQLAIIVPCHRVVGSDGKLVGYAGGLHRKKWLLDFEAKENGALTLGL